MKNIIFYPVVALMLLVFTTGCDEQHPTAYKNDPAVYFSYNGVEVGQADTITYSFGYSSADEYTFNLQVTTQGELSTVDRSISIRQYNTEPEGEAVYDTVSDPERPILIFPQDQPARPYNEVDGTGHYLPFTDPRIADSLSIKAGRAKTTIPIIIKKEDPSLIDTRFILRLELVPTDDFRLGMHEHTKFCLVFTGRMEKPNTWDSFYRNFFGASWGPVKMNYIIGIVGEINWNSTLDYTFANYLGNLVKVQYKQEYTDNPDPNAPKALYERDGTEVRFS